MLRHARIALALAAMLALGAANPGLAQPSDGEGLSTEGLSIEGLSTEGFSIEGLPGEALIIEGMGKTLPDLALDEAGGLDVDLRADALEQFDVAALPGDAGADDGPVRNIIRLPGLPIIETDVSEPSEGCVILGMQGDYISDVAGALDRVNEIRLEACREGVDNPANPGTPLTMDDYVPIKWSSDLEYIARIRAAEAAITLAHERLTDKDIFFELCGPSGYHSWGEVIAWNWSGGVTMGIDQWYSEKADWVDKTPGAVTGHYTQMINPRNIYFGLGTFLASDAHYVNTTVGEFSFERDLDETPMDFSGWCLQKLEVKADYIDGASLIGHMSGVSGDTSLLALAASVMDSDLIALDGVTWSSSSPGIADVAADGTVTAARCGTASISAESPEGLTASTDFTVNHKQEALPAVAPTCTEAGLTAGVRCPVCGEVLEAQQPVPALRHDFGDWTTTRRPTVFQEGARQRTCAVCGVRETGTVPALDPQLQLSMTAVTLAKTKSRTVKVALAKGDSFTARTSNKKIAKVACSGGKLVITARKRAGTATVTVRTKTGLTADIEVEVSRAKTKKLTCRSVTVRKGKKATLKPKVSPSWSDDPVTFESADPRIATVSSKGVVKGKRRGRTTIIVRSGEKTVKVKVKVK